MKTATHSATSQVAEIATERCKIKRSIRRAGYEHLLDNEASTNTLIDLQNTVCTYS